MSTELLEQKVAELERRLEAIELRTGSAVEAGDIGSGPLNQEEAETSAASGPWTPSQAWSKDSWKDLIGWEKDDQIFRSAMRLGAEWRQKMNLERR